MKNTRYVNYTNDGERSRLMEEYQQMGYYVTTEDGRLKVNSKHPKRKTEKKEERPRRERG